MVGRSILPELEQLNFPNSLLRIPDQLDVPLTSRVTRLVDSSAFRRLASVRQLGFVSLIYPGATHSRFEHSLGVYRNALLFLRQLMPQPEFRDAVTKEWAERFLVAALLHDIGHWPYCHPVEDLKLDGIPDHEELAANYLATEQLSGLLRKDWGIRPDEIADLLQGTASGPASDLVSSMLSGPVDIDKLDYLMRDSLHCGVPYGRNFDVGRLISSLCVNSGGSGIALSSKGRTAAELLVFARYVMFSEVYWHHAVRSATAMFQRAFFELRGQLPIAEMTRLTDETFAQRFLTLSGHHPAGELVQCLFGAERRLYKRWAQFNFVERPEIFRRLARQPMERLVAVAEAVAVLLRKRLGTAVSNLDVLVDAPPPGLEVQFEIEIRDVKRQTSRPLAELSPMVQSLARVQFDDYVKQVRVFLHPRLTDLAEDIESEPVLLEALESLGL
jgi:HD superfamily phosphohydrolase